MTNFKRHIAQAASRALNVINSDCCRGVLQDC